MSKDLEAIKYLNDTCINFLDRTKELYCTVTFTRKRAEILRDDIAEVEQALKHLESIDNANPSEALEELEKFTDFYDTRYNRICINAYNTIKQALLKAQEPKHYLKWEDLEFGKTTHKLKAKMNGNLYRVEWYIDGLGAKVVCLDKYITNDYLIHSACIKDYNQQFFNDLHLERVEE